MSEIEYSLEDLKISEFLAKYRKVTMGHIQNHGGKWSIEDQINNIHSEVTEVYYALHGKHMTNGNNQYAQIAEELCDVIFSSLTVFHLLTDETKMLYNDHEIAKYLSKTLAKIEKRVEDKKRKS